jgi:CheY-like chemotaxis protein
VEKLCKSLILITPDRFLQHVLKDLPQPDHPVLALHPGTVDLVLLDMTMPGMTTDDIVQAIRDINAHVPILLTSSYTSTDTVKRMLEEGTVQGFLPKPYKLKELLSTINQLLERP